MQHNNNISPQFKGFPVAGFLITSIPFIIVVADYMTNTQRAGYVNGIVWTSVINEDYIVDEIEGISR